MSTPQPTQPLDKLNINPITLLTLIAILLLGPAAAYTIGYQRALHSRTTSPQPQPTLPTTLPTAQYTPTATPVAPTHIPNNRLDTYNLRMPNMPLDAFLYQALTDAPRLTQIYRNGHNLYFDIEYLGCTTFGTTYVIRTDTLTPEEFKDLKTRITMIWLDIHHPDPPCDKATFFHLQDNQILPGEYQNNPSILPTQATNTFTP